MITASFPSPAVEYGLRSLQNDLPRILAESRDDSEFWQAFGERASLLEDIAGPDGWIFVNDKLDGILQTAGIDRMQKHRRFAV